MTTQGRRPSPPPQASEPIRSERSRAGSQSETREREIDHHHRRPQCQSEARDRGLGANQKRDRDRSTTTTAGVRANQKREIEAWQPIRSDRSITLKDAGLRRANEMERERERSIEDRPHRQRHRRSWTADIRHTSQPGQDEIGWWWLLGTAGTVGLLWDLFSILIGYQDCSSGCS